MLTIVAIDGPMVLLAVAEDGFSMLQGCRCHQSEEARLQFASITIASCERLRQRPVPLPQVSRVYIHDRD